jgi:hypothetical protein
MTNFNNGRDNTDVPGIDAELLRFLDRQFELMDESTRIDAALAGCKPERSPERVALVEKSARLREQAEQELHAHLRAHTTQATTPRFAAVSLLAAAYAHSSIGSPLEDDVPLYAISQIVERFCADCRVTAVRDRIEDLLNIAHRKATLVNTSRRNRGQTSSTGAAPVTGANDPMTDDDMFGFPKL